MAYFPQQKTLTIGGRTFTADEVDRFESGTTGFIFVSAVTTAGRVTNLRKSNGTAYQVPAAKKLVIVAAKSMQFNGASAASSGVSLGYSDDEASLDDTAVSNAVYMGGTAEMPVTQNSNLSPHEGGAYFRFEVPANKYPWIRCSTSTGAVAAIVYAFLEDA